MNTKGRPDLWPWALAGACAAVLCTATGLIPAWGRWYPASQHHADQVEALLQGRLSLGDDPAALRVDLAWAQGGVQQVWGLGVPLWRLPPEAALRLLGTRDLPGLLAFAAALVLAAWLVLRALRAADGAPAAGARRLAAAWPAAGGALLLLGYPPFVNLLRSRFDVYEEVIAYEYLWGLALIAGLVRLAARPTPARAAVVGLLAGWGGFVRPTLVLHGIGALAAVACLPAWRRDAVSAPARRRLAAACGTLFLLGGTALYATNHARFGDGFCFGHRLNLQSLYGSLYATRFDHPYADEPLGSAARELFGMMFRADTPNGAGFYRQDLFAGQSATVRWREVYLATYDLTHLSLLLAAAGLVAWRAGRAAGRVPGGRRAVRGAAAAADTIGAALGVYAAVSAALLAAFYLRGPLLSSRYALDLMPSFAALLLAGWLGWCAGWQRRRHGNAVLALSLAVLAIWISWQLGRAEPDPRPRQVLTRGELAARQRAAAPAAVTLPASGCYAGPAEAAATGIPYNGSGWWSPTGQVQACVILFVDDPAWLELEITPRAPADTLAAPADLRAKIGLEHLVPESIRRTHAGWAVRFGGPRSPRYRRGLQPVFIATVPPAQLAGRETPWRLLRACWRGAPLP